MPLLNSPFAVICYGAATALPLAVLAMVGWSFLPARARTIRSRRRPWQQTAVGIVVVLEGQLRATIAGIVSDLDPGDVLFAAVGRNFR